MNIEVIGKGKRYKYDKETEERKKRLYDLLGKIVKYLDDKEKTVIEYMYGLNGKEIKETEEIAEIMGIKGVTVKIIHDRALRKLKNSSQSGELSRFLDFIKMK